MKKEEIVTIINQKYSDYEGYVQFSHRAIDKEKDIFTNGKKVSISDESGFVYEAHFFNGTNSVTIKQINDDWRIDESKNIPQTDIQTYETKYGLRVKMAQIWEDEPDQLCEEMDVKKLKKVVFAGFEGELK